MLYEVITSKNMLAQTPGETAQEILEKSGYIDFWKADKSVESAGRIENLRELIGSMDEFATISEFFRITSYNVCYTKLLRRKNSFLPTW